MGPRNYTGTKRNDYCLKRNFNPNIAKQYLGAAGVQNTLAQKTFEDFITPLEGVKFSTTQLGQHAGGHAAVGGTVRSLLLLFLSAS